MSIEEIKTAPLPLAAPLASAADLPAVVLSDLAFSHERGVPVLEDVNLNVGQGDFLALLGPNGGGKSTLLRLILGLEQPCCGSITVFGRPPAEGSRQIGYVPQFSSMQRDFPASVLDMVLMGGASPDRRGGSWESGPAARERARSYLDLLGLGGLEKRGIGALSGGQRQRALVARALMGSNQKLDAREAPCAAPSPFLLLLDEPTASIDPEGKFCFYEFLDRLRGHITIIVVSHDLFVASPFFSGIVFVNKTVTELEQSGLSPENLTLLFGKHLHDCPIADLQHAGNSPRHEGCTHPSCWPDRGNTV